MVNMTHLDISSQLLYVQLLSSTQVNKFTSPDWQWLSVLCIPRMRFLFLFFFFCAMGQTWDGEYVHLVEKRFITQSKCSILTQVFIEGVGRLCSLCQCFSREGNWDGHCSGKETNAVPDNHLSSESLCHLSYRCGCNVQCFAFSCFHL